MLRPSRLREAPGRASCLPKLQPPTRPGGRARPKEAVVAGDPHFVFTPGSPVAGRGGTTGEPATVHVRSFIGRARARRTERGVTYPAAVRASMAMTSARPRLSAAQTSSTERADVIAAARSGATGAAPRGSAIVPNNIRTAASRTAASSIPGIVARILSPSISLERGEEARRVPGVWLRGETRLGGASRRCASSRVVRESTRCIRCGVAYVHVGPLCQGCAWAVEHGGAGR